MSEQSGGPAGSASFPVCVAPPVHSSAWEAWAAQGSSAAGGFWLNPVAARECVTQMRQALDQMGDIKRDLHPFKILTDPLDGISRDFVKNCAAALQDARDFFSAWRIQLESAIDAIEQQIKAYESVDERNRTRYA